ncbi:HEAT repeat protein [Xylariaceae sp. FL0016]|nr:HEAT repeat protein [Xylariaceae sp. FL0016]
MPSTHSGRIVKSRRGKTGTPHQKNHRWEGFSAKISKLHSLDPLKRVRRHDLDAENLESTTSYLNNGLEKWSELNVSKGFISFRREMRPFCDSLPQILHFEEDIMNVLAKYISAQDKESLEPLLELLTAFAHDLGTRFEKHYLRALSLITEIARRPQDAAVIEWTFACLAFLFKYLSKLLAPDLRPSFDALTPLLGKRRNAPHIARFAAEALSFLVKKASSPANREKSLPGFIEHVRNDFSDSRENRNFELYYHGLMTMFAEAIKGQGHGVHTTGPELVRALIASIPDDDCVSEEPTTWSDLVCGVLVSIVHHTTPETFGLVSTAILEAAAHDEARKTSPIRNCLYIRCLGTISGVRKGTRITNWTPMIGCLMECMKSATKTTEVLEEMGPSAIWQQVVANAAIVWQQAPMDATIPYITDFVTVMTREPLMAWFIPFCSYFSRLDSARFRSLFLKPFQKFVVMHWSESSNEEMLCVFVPRMVESRALPSVADAEDFSLPQSWQDQIVTKFERLEVSPFPEQGASSAYNKDPKTWHDRCLPKYSALLRLLEITTVRPSTIAPISDLLLRKVKLALRPSSTAATAEACFIVSQGFSAYLRMSKVTGQLEASIAPLLKAAMPRYCRLTGFLEAMLAYEEQVNDQRSPVSSDSADCEKGEDPFLRCLIENLSRPSHDHRLASLRLLGRLEAAPDELDCLRLMLQTEELDLNLQNIRVFAMNTRHLAANYPSLSINSWLRRAIPSFLFGLLTVKLTPIWDSTVDALQQISQDKSGEEVVCDTALKWLDVPSKRWDGIQNEAAATARAGQTDFECRNLAGLQKLAEDIQQTTNTANELMLGSFQKGQELVAEAPLNARSQALKVLLAVPALAEKRSRKVVPYFLSWVLDTEEQDMPQESLDELSGKSWSLYDKKSLLGVFSQFSNPKVLYQSQQVYEGLLRLLANGDADVQKSSLKAILAWKQEGVKPYQENLEYLLDDARFKNELTVLFQGENQVQPEHRVEVMPVLLRLLYGRAISKKGIASGRHGLQANRLAIIRKLTVEDMGSFLEIALGELRDAHVIENGTACEALLNREVIPPRKQVGFLNMMESIIHELGASVIDYLDRILNAVLYCLVSSCRKLYQVTDEDEENTTQDSLLRTIRTTSLKCTIACLRNAPSFEWTPYKDLLILEVVSPRLEKLATENTQGISATLLLLSTLSQLPKAALFLAIDGRIIRKLTECLAFEKAKDEVRIFALGIIRNLIKLSQLPADQSEFNELITEELLEPNVDLILGTIESVLKAEEEIGKDLLLACVELVVELSPIVQQSNHVADLIDVSEFLLREPAKRVNPKIKSVVLSMLERFLGLEGMVLDPSLADRIYSTVSSLYGFFRDQPSRTSLSRILNVLLQGQPELEDIAKICADLNAFRENRIDEPDFSTRLSAFNTISQSPHTRFTPRAWEPIVYNLVFYIKHDEEYGVLSANSADAICKFIDAAVSAKEQQERFQDMLSNIIMPSIHANAKDPSETVRRETVRVLGYLVSHMPQWSGVSDLVNLDPKPDEKDLDPSFFNNILSPASARQMRALQLLSKVGFHSAPSSRHLAHFFVPLLEHFIFNRGEESDDHGVGAQAATTIADLAISLEWPQYRAILRRYISYVESKPEHQKQLIRLLGKFVDSLEVAANEKRNDSMDLDITSPHAGINGKHRLAVTMPAEEKFNEDVLSNILPGLFSYLHDKDETTVSSRVPVGIILVKVLKLLPIDSLDQKLPGVLTDICHILRSKAWESREMARDTLSKMTSLLGPSYFGFVLNELRGALTTGYQLHVLSYTMHSVLVNGIPQFQPGDLDYCLSSVVAIIMDDIFGATGQEKDAEEYISKMKEVKSSKSQDSMELIARRASITHLVELVRPLQSLLLEKLDLRMVRKIDDLLTRISTGLLANAAAESRDTLVFCYEIVQRVYESEKPEAETTIDPKLKRYLIQKGAKKSGERGTTSKYTHKLVRFSLDVLRSVFKKHDSLRNASNISGFIPILGDAVVGGEEEVRIAAFKLMTVLTKVPFKSDDASKLYKVTAKEAIKSISASTSTSTDLAQTALKLMSVILRDRRDVVIKDSAVDLLLGKLKDDLTEPLYRHVTFNFLRSVMDKKVESATVYDTMDYVGTVMITNDDKDTRDLARGAFFQFLRDYPQKKNRWAKQLSFVVANLKYDREGGRLSVMEVIHLLLMKSADDFVQEIASNCFIPLVFVLANDDSDKCRLASGELIKDIFRKADKERTSKFLMLAKNWVDQEDNAAVLRLGIQSLTLYFEAKEPNPKDRKDLQRLIEAASAVLERFSELTGETDLIATVVQTVQILIDKYPVTTLAHERLWQLAPGPLAHSDNTIKLSTVRLISLYLADFHQNNKNAHNTEQIMGSHGLHLDPTAVQRLVIDSVGLLNAAVVLRWRRKQGKKGYNIVSDIDTEAIALNTPELDETLATEASRIILMLSRFLEIGSSQAENAKNEEAEVDASDDEEEWAGLDEEDEDEDKAQAPKITLATLFTWLSDILVEETRPKASALLPKVAALDILTLLTSTLPQASLQPNLNTILTPLHHITDPSIPAPFVHDEVFKTRHEGIKTKATETMDAMQRKFGTAVYSREVLAIRERAKRRREGRSRKRKIEAVNAPDRHGKWKKGRLEKKVKRRKEKGQMNRDRRREY